MADVAGFSKATIARIWQTFGLQSHRLDTFKLSADPQFVEKVRDIVGLYFFPPDRAIVLCLDEKSQVQALDRTRPLLPLRPGIPAQQTHDYIRHGTTSLFAALNVASGKVIGQCHRRHRHQELLRFLNRLDADLTSTVSRLSGQRPQTPSSTRSNDSANELLRHDTSCCVTFHSAPFPGEDLDRGKRSSTTRIQATEVPERRNTASGDR